MVFDWPPLSCCRGSLVSSNAGLGEEGRELAQEPGQLRLLHGLPQRRSEGTQHSTSFRKEALELRLELGKGGVRFVLVGCVC